MKQNIFSVILFTMGLVLLVGHVDTETGISSLNLRHKRESLTSEVIDFDNKSFISGEFKANSQNLNKISLHLYVPNEFKRGEVFFRLKKNGQEHWKHESIQPIETQIKNEKTTFVFPPIRDSKENIYRFELQYVGTKVGGRIIVKNGDYAFISSYDIFYDRQITLGLIYELFVRKLPEIILIPGILQYIFLAFFPFFVSLLSFARRWPGFLAILTGIFVVEELTSTHLDIDITTTTVIFTWVLLLIEGNLSYEVPALFSLIPLSFLMILDRFEAVTKIGEAASWTYVFLFITIFSFVYSTIATKSRKISSIQLFHHLLSEYEQLTVILKKIPPIIYKIIAVILSIKLLWSSILLFSDCVKWYLDFFPNDQYRVFFAKTGWMLAVIYFVLVSIYIRSVRNSKHKLLITLAILLLIWKVQKFVIDGTTSFKDSVVIMDIKPNNINEPWVDVTIEGRNFNELPFSGVVYVDGEKQRIIRWSDREIMFRTDPSSTKTGRLYVGREDSKSSNFLDFIYLGNL